MLGKYKKALSEKETSLISGQFDGLLTPDKTDHFHKLCIRTSFNDGEVLGLLLEQISKVWTLLDSANGKILYQRCVKTLNMVQLKDKKATLWRDIIGGQFDVKPVWNTLYKPPLTKNTSDLQCVAYSTWHYCSECFHNS